MTMRYPQWDYITVQSFVFTSGIVSEVCLLKRKKKKNSNNEKMNNGTYSLLQFGKLEYSVEGAVR